MGRIAARESESEAVANGGVMIFVGEGLVGTIATSSWSSGVMVSGFSRVLNLESISEVLRIEEGKLLSAPFPPSLSTLFSLGFFVSGLVWLVRELWEISV